MSARLFYCYLELKRAWKRLPHICAGAIVLFILMGTVALLSSRMLYGKQASGRIPVGIVVPEGDSLSRQAVSMMSSLDSVKSLCDFSYFSEEEALAKLKNRQLYAVLKLPERMIEGIINGTNPPALIILPKGAGPESRIFKELADAGAGILSASQAGIYAGDELCSLYLTEGAVTALEKDLNQIYLSYSLPRADYFKKVKVSATGDLETLPFYGISAAAFVLLMCAIPASGYLIPLCPVTGKKMRLMGIGSGTVIGARICGLTALLAALALPAATISMAAGWFSFYPAVPLLLLLVCIACASFCVLIFQAAGSLLGGVMLLFLIAVSSHLLAGGFLPLVFLPDAVRAAAPYMPSSILMDGLSVLLTEDWSGTIFIRLGIMTAVCSLASILLEVKRHV